MVAFGKGVDPLGHVAAQAQSGQLCSMEPLASELSLARGISSSSGSGSRSPEHEVAELERLETAINGLRAGIVELEQSPSYLMLVDAGPSTVTGAEYASAVRQAKNLWTVLEAASDQVELARRFANEHALTQRSTDRRRLGDLHLLLAQTLPVKNVGDPTDAGAMMTATEALASVRQRYDAIHQGVKRIDDAWLNVLPRVEAARETAARLEGEAEALGVVEPLIGRAKSRAENLAERLVSDPISVDPKDGPELDLLVGEAARQMAELRRGHDDLDEDLAKTEELLAGLRVLRIRAEAAGAETRQKIVDPHDLVVVPDVAILDGPGGLSQQLDDLFELARRDLAGSGSGSAWTQQRAVLDRWLATAAKLERQLVSAEARNRRNLDRRDELRGRLQAFQAKMAARGKAESPEAMRLADTAWTELYTAPTDLDSAEAAIVQLATELRES